MNNTSLINTIENESVSKKRRRDKPLNFKKPQAIHTSVTINFDGKNRISESQSTNYEKFVKLTNANEAIQDLSLQLKDYCMQFNDQLQKTTDVKIKLMETECELKEKIYEIEKLKREMNNLKIALEESKKEYEILKTLKDLKEKNSNKSEDEILKIIREELKQPITIVFENKMVHTINVCYLQKKEENKTEDNLKESSSDTVSFKQNCNDEISIKTVKPLSDLVSQEIKKTENNIDKKNDNSNSDHLNKNLNVNSDDNKNQSTILTVPVVITENQPPNVKSNPIISTLKNEPNVEKNEMDLDSSPIINKVNGNIIPLNQNNLSHINQITTNPFAISTSNSIANTNYSSNPFQQNSYLQPIANTVSNPTNPFAQYNSVNGVNNENRPFTQPQTSHQSNNPFSSINPTPSNFSRNPFNSTVQVPSTNTNTSNFTPSFTNHAFTQPTSTTQSNPFGVNSSNPFGRVDQNLSNSQQNNGSAMSTNLGVNASNPFCNQKTFKRK